MTTVNSANVREYAFSMIDDTHGKIFLNMDLTPVDGNDSINLKSHSNETEIQGGNGDDIIYGSQRHANNLYGDVEYADIVYMRYDTEEYMERLYATNYDKYNGNDTLYGGDCMDVLSGGRGSDNLYGGLGLNIYTFRNGDGNDYIYSGININNVRVAGAKDYVYFYNGKFSDIKMERYNSDLVIHHGKSDTVNIKNYYSNQSVRQSVKGVVMKWESTNDAHLMDNNITAYDDGYVSSTGSNSYEPTVQVIEKELNNNVSKISDLTKKGMIITYTKAANIKGTSGSDTINGSKYKDTINAGKGNDYIDAGKGNDIIYAEKGKNTIIGGKGNDQIYSGTGADSIVLSKGSAKDIIYNANKSDKLVYKDLDSLEKLKLTKKGNDLIISRKDKKTDKITIDGFYKTKKKLDKVIIKDGKQLSLAKDVYVKVTGKGLINGSAYSEIIKGSKKADKIYGKAGNDKITAGKGNDTINAGKGNNFIYFGSKDGKDTVVSGKGTDTLVFKSETDINNLTLAKSSNNLVITYSGGKVTLKDYYKGNHSAKYIQIANETYAILNPNESYDYKDAKNIVGTSGNDTITGKGNTNLYGGKGDDTYVIDYTTSGSNGIISDTAGQDSVILKALSNDINVFFNVKKDGTSDNNLIIKNNPTNSTLSVKDYFTTGKTETIKSDSDGKSLDDNVDYNAIKQAVAGWLSTNNYADVTAAITDSAKGAQNYTLLMGNKYFGQIAWKDATV